MNPFMRFCFAYVLAAFCAIGALSARAQESHWGAEHIRERVAQWLSDNGRRVSSPDTIGPLDPRVRVAACEELQISGRSAASSSLIVECKAPAPWRFVLRTDAGPVGSILPGVPSAPGAREWTVVTPRTSLAAGTVLSEDALEERVVTSPPPAQALRSLSQAAGLRLTASVTAGVALTTRNVARTPLVLKGESVMLVATGSGFEIAAPARAEEDGYEGDLIAVRNIKTGVALKGRLERDKKVIVSQM
jgi:flagella basal body P-ring formation protein FlgA